MKVLCPHCKNVLDIPDQYKNTKGKCNHCGKGIIPAKCQVPKATGDFTREKKKRGCATGCLIVFLVFFGLAVIRSIGQKTEQAFEKKPAQESKPVVARVRPEQSVRNSPVNTLPEYRIIDTQTDDTPGKAMVTKTLLIQDENITEAGLRDILNYEYRIASTTKGFRYHKTPTVIAIWAFQSLEHAESGMGQWIAMLNKSPDSPLNIRIDDRQLKDLHSLPAIKFRLSENKRKAIWKELIRAEDKSWAEAEVAFPIDPTQAMKPGTTFTLSKQTPIRAQKDYADPWEGLKATRQLPAGTTIKVMKVECEDLYKEYYVAVQGGGNGWIHSIPLINQSNVDGAEQMRKQGELRDELNAKYDNEIAGRHGLTKEQLDEISEEGLTKGWAFPK